MSQEPARFSWIARLGLVLISASFVPWLCLPLLPWLPLTAPAKALWAGGLLAAAEALFWGGAVLAGQEAARRCRAQLTPRALGDWLRRWRWSLAGERADGTDAAERERLMPELSIQPEPPEAADSVALIAELDAYLNARYRPENRHGLSVAALADESVTFLVARLGGAAVGCGAVKFFPKEYAEVKRMYVRPAWRGRGVARTLLTEIERRTRQEGLTVLRLETGIHQPEAVGLYERAGFARCPPFGEYREDGVSLCYEKRLAPVWPPPE